jgi:CCR4-NOT transcription complex subunit 7/8
MYYNEPGLIGVFTHCTDTRRGYDFGYLLKLLTNEPLPTSENEFFALLAVWFPCIYDIKHVIRSVKTLRGGLQEIAESLGVCVISLPHNPV